MAQTTAPCLAIDIGGKKTAVVRCEIAGAPGTVLRSQRYRSGEYVGIGKIVERFLSERGYCPESVIRGPAWCCGLWQWAPQEVPLSLN